MNSVYVQRTIRFLLILAAIIAFILAIYFLSSLTYPFIIAWGIAFMMNPLVNFLQVKGRIPRAISVLIVLILIFGVLAGLLTLLITQLISGTEYLSNTLPNHINNIIKYIENWITGTVTPLFNNLTSMFNNLNKGQQETIIQNINDIGANIASTLGNFLQSMLKKIPAFISWFPNAATVLIFTLLATFFISKDWYKLKKMAGKFIPIRFRRGSMKVYIDLRKALFGFIRAQVTLISITAITVLIGLLILRVNYAIAIAFITGIIDLLPYLGTGLVFVPWIIYEFIVNNYSLGIGLLVLYIVVLVQRQIIEPKIVSTNIGISPLASLVSIFIGLQLFGFVGLIIGPIVAVLLNTLYKANAFHRLWDFVIGKK
ncbi:sporulation integral membrane protein YtvI [Caldifermentibacillus hisashii]|uniref:sporulation integral membrane protein YtvI n=1 Tax=Caldifermentibacillus hisashii TaxID=996558 RepID=UPI003D255049